MANTTQNQQVAPSGASPSAQKAITVAEQFRRDLNAMGPQFAMQLPPHIPLDRFMRTVMTAVQLKPGLLKCNRQSLWTACMAAASDGLLPDGKQGAIVPFGDDEDGRKAPDKCTWMPMIFGIRMKARNSGEISDWYCEVVHEGDEFDYQLGDDPHIFHKPAKVGGRRRAIVLAYSICKFKDGTISREVMTIQEIEDVRQHYSRAKKGPWSDPVAYPEMCRKTVGRLHSKQLPMSTDLAAVLERDNALYDFAGAKERAKEAQATRPSSAAAMLQSFGGEGGDDEPDDDAPDQPQPGGDTTLDHDPQTGEVLDHDADGVVKDTKRGASTKQPAKQADKPTPQQAFLHLTGSAEKHPPKTADQFKILARGVIDAAKDVGAAGADRLNSWWTSEVTRKLRNGAGMTGDDTAEIYAEIKAACEELVEQ